MQPIATPRLQLVPLEERHKVAFQQGTAELAALLGARVPEGWPHFPEAFVPAAEGQPFFAVPTEWPAYLFLYPAESVLVGNGGFASGPDAQGAVEIGYEIAPACQNRGFATEVVQTFIEYAFARPAVRAVVAHTLGEPNPSNRVLQKVGMSFAGALDDPDLGTIWRWQLDRGAYEARVTATS